MRLLLISIACLLIAAFPTAAQAETPVPSQGALLTQPAEVSPELTATPSPQATAVVPATAESSVTAETSIEIRLTEDRNDSGALDSDDGSPSMPTLVELIPWSRTTESPGVYDPSMVVLGGITADDGTMKFVDVPADTYTLRIWWAAGFVRGGSPTVRDVYQVVFSIDGRGGFGPVDETNYMPGVLGDAKDQRKEVAEVGSPPSEILLNRKPEGLFPYPVGTGGSHPVAIGVLDVAATLGGEPVTLQDTGTESSQRQLHLELILLGAVALAGGAAAFVTLRRI